MSEEEIKALCMEWYIMHGERGILLENLRHVKSLAQMLWTQNYLQVEAQNPDLKGKRTVSLTPKALELIKGTTNETKT